MPDSAFVDTEDQFRRATPSAGGRRSRARSVHDHRYPAVSHEIASVIESRYRGLDDLWPIHPTRSSSPEPSRPSWRWSTSPTGPTWLTCWSGRPQRSPTVLLSCLASHASILLFDGIERVQRPRKCSGVFTGTVTDPDDPLALGLPHEVAMPHSRAQRGARRMFCSTPDTGSSSAAPTSPAGWAVAARECGDSLFVLCQGHPEYSTLSLLREYRRDVRRFLFGRGTLPYPCLPEGYLSALAVHRLDRFAARACRSGAGSTRAVGRVPVSRGGRRGAEHVGGVVDRPVHELDPIRAGRLARCSLSASCATRRWSSTGPTSRTPPAR